MRRSEKGKRTREEGEGFDEDCQALLVATCPVGSSPVGTNNS